MKKPEFKKKFVERYTDLLGEEVNDFLEKSLEFLPRTIRVNTNKIEVKELRERLEAKGWNVKPVKFYDKGFIIKNDEALGNTYEHFLGYYYVQEAASMIPPIILNPSENDSVLDSCAAPGSKTTQLSMEMNNSGLVVSNEVKLPRLAILASNVQRMGCKNVIITKGSGTGMHAGGIKYDKILVDAPCSATGAIRKNLKIITQWNENVPLRICSLQKKILYSSLQALKKGGELVYSTCNLEPEENENVVNHAIEKYGVKVLPVKLKGLKTRPGITSWKKEDFDKSIKNCARIYPQDNNTEGFFVARMTK